MNTNTRRFHTTDDTDLPQVSLDLTRNTAVIIRRVTRHQETQLFSQEQLLLLARLVRGENDNTHLRLYFQDGNGAEEGTTTLRDDVQSGLIGSIVALRPDRVFHKQAAPSIDLLQKQHIVVIVPGKRIYSFLLAEDVKAFQAQMQEAHDYITTAIRYMRMSYKPSRERRVRSSNKNVQ